MQDTQCSDLSLLRLSAEQREEITTRVLIHLPQVDPEPRKIFFDHLNAQAKEHGISYTEWGFDFVPDFWGGPIWVAEIKGVNFDIIRQLRDYAWNCYKGLIEQTKEKTPFDYKPMQEHLILNAARVEHDGFIRSGLSVPVESQAAFFSVMVSGI